MLTKNVANWNDVSAIYACLVHRHNGNVKVYIMPYL